MSVKMLALNSDALATLRKGKDLSQSELARRAGIARVTVNRLENGQSDAVTFATVNALAEALGVDANTFVGFDSAPKKPATRKRGRG
jgi:transcriptional regulator with XRE-family HTH domain